MGQILLEFSLPVLRRDQGGQLSQKYSALATAHSADGDRQGPAAVPVAGCGNPLTAWLRGGYVAL